MTLIQRTALEGGSIEPKDIYLKLRNTIPNGGLDEVMSRQEIVAFAEQSVKLVAESRFPVERERMRLDICEGELRADLLDELAKLDLSNPRIARELYETHRKIGSSTGEPTLREAIDTLAVSGVSPDTMTALVARLNEIYPPEADE